MPCSPVAPVPGRDAEGQGTAVPRQSGERRTVAAVEPVQHLKARYDRYPARLRRREDRIGDRVTCAIGMRVDGIRSVIALADQQPRSIKPRS